MDIGTIITAVEAVNKAIEIYKRIDDLPQQMTKLGERMERQKTVLLQVEAFIRQYGGDSDYPILQSGQTADLKRILGNIKDNAGRVYDLFDRVEKDILSREHNLQFRHKWAAQIWFALVEKQPDKIQDIMDEIKHDRKELSDYIGIMNSGLAAQILKKQKNPTPTNNNNNNGSNKPTKEIAIPKPRPKPSPSVSPLPTRRDYKVLFVDPRNQARSVVAEAYLKLNAQLTRKAGAKAVWRIKSMHSAGFFVRNRSNITDIIDKELDYSQPSNRFPLVDGAEPPNPVAMAALFDNNSYPYSFKKGIQEKMTAKRSCGLRRDIFKNYDYIIVFTNREHENMVKLKEALYKKGENGERGKGRVLHLGMYTPLRNGAPRDIVTVAPRKGDDGKTVERRSDWNMKVSEIKIAIRAFLKEEMRWEKPDETQLGMKGSAELTV
ncbi:hypothetical protein B0H66DRAFT_476455 [Apodospora peruviana]|uniref:Uncharacterized protein n=1 Tax=Apodospora peruviana TaxID=516989 RepID=A0AAE0M670_9PEZI|nr:hypothetical protein B0H66DRAFT_476455 [Apodospora peruviana]